VRKIFEIEKIEEWNNINSCYSDYEIVILKYSTECHISKIVEGDFSEWSKSLSENYKIIFVKMNVLESLSLSKVLSTEFNVKHQSPQLIWLTKDRKVKWFANYYDINLRSLSAHLEIVPL
jgi:bacillithiol system protein YtxJ